MTAAELKGNIDTFLREHANDRQVMPIIGQLKSTSKVLGRIGAAQDTSKPTPGQKAAQRSGGQAFPPKAGAAA